MQKKKVNYIRFNGWVEPRQVKQLKKISKLNNISMSAMLRRLIDENITFYAE